MVENIDNQANKTKKFQRTKENFTCEVCGHLVKGDGYTNHCPNCLHSKHVDINPGDRSSACGGIMKPIEVLQKKGNFVINHKCQKCGFERKNKVLPTDNFSKVIEISTQE